MIEKSFAKPANTAHTGKTDCNKFIWKATDLTFNLYSASRWSNVGYHGNVISQLQKLKPSWTTFCSSSSSNNNSNRNNNKSITTGTESTTNRLNRKGHHPATPSQSHQNITNRRTRSIIVTGKFVLYVMTEPRKSKVDEHCIPMHCF